MEDGVIYEKTTKQPQSLPLLNITGEPIYFVTKKNLSKFLHDGLAGTVWYQRVSKCTEDGKFVNTSDKSLFKKVDKLHLVVISKEEAKLSGEELLQIVRKRLDKVEVSINIADFLASREGSKKEKELVGKILDNVITSSSSDEEEQGHGEATPVLTEEEAEMPQPQQEEEEVETPVASTPTQPTVTPEQFREMVKAYMNMGMSATDALNAAKVESGIAQK